ncbi:beta-N-acetylhexosaminidase [Pseudomonadota bacterium]
MMTGPLLIGLPGTRLEPQCREQLQHPAVGGVVLFTRNFESRLQLESLVSDIRNIRDPRLLVCIDQEGGRVQRLKDNGFTRLPPLGLLGIMGRSDPQKALDMAYRHGRVMATEMLVAGIDLSFAPVLDLDRGSSVIGDRALSADPNEVIRLGRAYIAGMHDSGMKTNGKHFPGHGSIVADSHVDDVSDPRSLEEILSADLRPFIELAAELDSLMIAHVVYPQVDELPAGYSREWLKEILRGKLAYKGVIFSDDLGMHAAKSVGGLGERTQLCLEAGCDLALVCQPEDVSELLGSLNELPDREGLPVSRLYGRPTVSKEELASVDREGVKEWRRWSLSLEALDGQGWS